MKKENSKTVNIIGFPMDLGADRRGVDMGPSALRIAGLKEKLEKLGCKNEIHIQDRQPRNNLKHAKRRCQESRARYWFDD